jgi:hypothetical protein
MQPTRRVSLAGARLFGIVDRRCLRVAHNDGERYAQGVLANQVARPVRGAASSGRRTRPGCDRRRSRHGFVNVTRWPGNLERFAQLTTGFAVAADGPRIIADAWGLACKRTRRHRTA